MSRRTVLACAAFAVAAVTAAATPALGSTPTPKPGASTASTTPGKPIGLTPQVQAKMAAQQPLIQAVDRVRALAGKDPNSGYTAAQMNADLHGITVYWNGALPSALSQEFASDRGRGVSVTVIPTKYNWEHLNSQMHAIAQATFNAKPASQDRVFEVDPNSDYSGLVVKFEPGASTSAQAAALSPTALAARALGEFPGLKSDIPFTVAIGKAGTSFSSREADTPPYYAGGVLRGTQYGNWCTTGFAASVGGRSGILTSAHCGWQNFNTGAGVGIGRTSAVTYSYDQQFIPASASPWVWDGPSINQSGQFVKDVVGVEGLSVTQNLCVSGAWTGAVCDNEIVRGPFVLAVPGMDGVWRDANLWEVYNLDTVAAVGQNDSGGPVFGLTNGNTEDIAAGLINGGETADSAPCIGVQNRLCVWAFYIVSVTDGASALGGSVLHY